MLGLAKEKKKKIKVNNQQWPACGKKHPNLFLDRALEKYKCSGQIAIAFMPSLQFQVKLSCTHGKSAGNRTDGSSLNPGIIFGFDHARAAKMGLF